jgi:hypothetical protein
LGVFSIKVYIEVFKITRTRYNSPFQLQEYSKSPEKFWPFLKNALLYVPLSKLYIATCPPCSEGILFHNDSLKPGANAWSCLTK